MFLIADHAPAGPAAILAPRYHVDNPNNPLTAKLTSAAGRAQALPTPFGTGRVVIFGEAAMLTAQNTNFRMNYPGTDDRQLTPDVMHWLTGLLN